MFHFFSIFYIYVFIFTIDASLCFYFCLLFFSNSILCCSMLFCLFLLLFKKIFFCCKCFTTETVPCSTPKAQLLLVQLQIQKNNRYINIHLHWYLISNMYLLSMQLQMVFYLNNQNQHNLKLRQQHLHRLLSVYNSFFDTHLSWYHTIHLLSLYLSCIHRHWSVLFLVVQ